MTRPLRIFLLVLLLPVLPAGAADGTRAHHSTRGPLLVAPRIDLVDFSQNENGVHGLRFSERDLRDLPGDIHTQRVELFSPGGVLYQRLSMQFTSPETVTRTETRGPVGGTWITEHSLFGASRVEVYLDDATTPVATSGYVLAR